MICYCYGKNKNKAPTGKWWLDQSMMLCVRAQFLRATEEMDDTQGATFPSLLPNPQSFMPKALLSRADKKPRKIHQNAIKPSSVFIVARPFPHHLFTPSSSIHSNRHGCFLPRGPSG